MEGVSSEAASLAGHLQLANLCWIYDNNHITIEGRTDLAFTEDVASRFLAYGWNVVRVGDANDLDLLEKALATFKACADRPTRIIVDSHIAWGSPHKHDSAAAHGEPLGEDEIRLTKRAYGWPEDAKFLVPDAVPDHFHRGLGARGRKLREVADARRLPAEHPHWGEAHSASNGAAARGLGSRPADVEPDAGPRRA
jgi:transketolase